MEFSKQIVRWAIRFTTGVTILTTIGYYITGRVPQELITLAGTVATGVILSYCTKAGVENVQKIKKGGDKK